MNTTFYTYVEDADGREHDLFVEIVDFRRRDDGSNDVVVAVSTADGLSAERLFENLPDKERERVLREAEQIIEIEALRAEVDALREALAAVVSWFPSADTYWRLGFDPEAPTRAYEAAKAVLFKENGNEA